MRQINGHTILMVLPEEKTLYRTVGEEPEEYFFYTIIADDGEQTVVATVRDPLTDTSWMHGDYFHGPQDKRRREALLVAMERSRMDVVLGHTIMERDAGKR